MNITSFLKNNAAGVATGLGALIGSMFPGNTVVGKLGRGLGASFGMSLSPAQQEANAFNKQMQDSAMTFNAAEAQKNRDFQQQMADTTYQRTVADLQNAGLNPALAMNKGASVPTPSGGAASAGAASSVSPAAGGILDMIIALKQLNIQEKLANADVRLKGAEAKKTETETSWIDTIEGLKAEGQRLANSLTEDQSRKIQAETDSIREQIKKTIEETHNEVLKGFLIEAQTNLANLDAKQKAELFPYQQALLKAQTDAQKAQAALAFANAAIQKGLLNAGYVEKTIEGLVNQNKKYLSEAELTQAKAQVETFVSNLRTGNIHVPLTNNRKIDDWLSKHVFGEICRSLTAVGELVVGPIKGIVSVAP